MDTELILQAIVENGYLDDFIEMLQKDCFAEAVCVFDKAIEAAEARSAFRRTNHRCRTLDRNTRD
jgi:hypothetical protein